MNKEYKIKLIPENRLGKTSSHEIGSKTLQKRFHSLFRAKKILNSFGPYSLMIDAFYRPRKK